MSNKNKNTQNNLTDKTAEQEQMAALQRKNAIKLILIVFVLPLVVVGISLATR
jgi:CHASE3 domain sensor protein